MSIRNDQVTRWRKLTDYDIEIFDTNTREITKTRREIKGTLNAGQIRKKLEKTMPKSSVIVSIDVVAQHKMFYTLGEEEYYSCAHLVETIDL